MNWTAFRQSKVYDVLTALPLLIWFGGAAIRLRPSLAALGAALLQGQVTWHGGLLFFALFASAAYNLLLVWLLLVRTVPVRRSKGWLPRLCGLVGATFSISILYLPPVQPPLFWLLLSDALLILGFTASLVVLSRLGRAFSILPEARMLVTGGAYAHVRHPLYAAEIVVLVGNIILFAQPWSLLLGAVAIALQVARAHYEEQVLVEAFPEYAAYRAGTARFIPGVI